MKLEFTTITSGEDTVSDTVGEYTDPVPMFSSWKMTFDCCPAVTFVFTGRTVTVVLEDDVT